MVRDVFKYANVKDSMLFTLLRILDCDHTNNGNKTAEAIAEMMFNSLPDNSKIDKQQFITDLRNL